MRNGILQVKIIVDFVYLKLQIKIGKVEWKTKL